MAYKKFTGEEYIDTDLVAKLNQDLMLAENWQVITHGQAITIGMVVLYLIQI